MRIAYFSPLSPQRSGISDYSEELLPRLAEDVDVDLFVDGFEPASPAIRRQFACYDVAEYADLQLGGGYALPLYQMGNSHYHEAIYRTLVRYPGITVLHELVLHHFVSEITQRRGNPAAFIREMAYAHGRAGAAVARAHARTGAAYSAPEYPLNRRAIDASLLVVVHSRYVAEQVRAIAPGAALAIVPPPAPTSQIVDRSVARARLGLPMDAFVVGSFGLATPEKRFHVALPAFKRLLDRRRDALYAVVGDVPPWHQLPELIDGLSLAGHVRPTGWVDHDTLGCYLSAVDVCVNLRYPTMGESSASLLRILAAGRPAIVSDVGAFSETPDDVCRKLPVGDGEEESLAATLLELAENASERRRLGDAARSFARTRHSIDATARGYLRAIATVVASDDLQGEQHCDHEGSAVRRSGRDHRDS